MDEMVDLNNTTTEDKIVITDRAAAEILRIKEHRLLPEAPHASYPAYLSAVGASAVVMARRQRPEALLEALKRSGLRGRGGAGFPVGTKWTTVFQHECPTRYAVANAAEGEPGTFKDRFLLRRNPYAVIEGLLIAAHVVGAKAAYIGIKASFKREIARLTRALDEMADVVAGLPVMIIEGPDDYLFGEEKALLNVIEGGGPLPREVHYPPYERGLFATPLSPNPALVNNVETLAHVSTIVRHGAESFRELGTADTPGTVLFTLSGDIVRPGVYECESGISLRSLLYEVGGGPRPGRKLKVVLSGVAAAPIFPEQLDTPGDFGSLSRAGSGLGSAGLIVIDDATSIPRVAQAVTRFLYVESCGQCPACTHGLGAASAAIDRAFEGPPADGSESAIVGARSAPQGNRCYLPVQGSLLIPALIERFKHEFTAEFLAQRRVAPEWLIPKLVDFDEVTQTFTYDQRQASEQPNGTYAEPPSAAPNVVAHRSPSSIGRSLEGRHEAIREGRTRAGDIEADTGKTVKMDTLRSGEMPKHVVILGAGFGGLYAARALRRAQVRVTVVDRRNHHLFQPLLYQVATAALSPSEIAAPIRGILRRHANTTVVLSEARSIAPDRNVVILSHGEMRYDFLIVATGATHSYFGHDEWATHAPALKTIEDALEIRRRVLFAYEAAEVESDPQRRRDWLTFVVIGGGPTGVELAGALAELSRHTLVRDFRRIDPKQARIILLEGLPRVLPSYAPILSEKAQRQLASLDVEVRTNAHVTHIDEHGVSLGNERIPARTVLWCAGVAASPLAKSLGVPLDRAGRVLLRPDLTIPGHDDVFVVGDLAAVEKNGKLVPGVASAAVQEGLHAAQNIVRALRGEPYEPFRYIDKGSLATIGRSRAVAEVRGLKLSGFVAWLAWLAIHVFFLIGFRNRFIVIINWAYSYLTFRRGARLITGPLPLRSKEPKLEASPPPSAW